jgi:hypothetical protein
MEFMCSMGRAFQDEATVSLNFFWHSYTDVVTLYGSAVIMITLESHVDRPTNFYRGGEGHCNLRSTLFADARPSQVWKGAKRWSGRRNVGLKVEI